MNEERVARDSTSIHLLSLIRITQISSRHTGNWVKWLYI